jgi:hypothetical protein
MRLRYNLGGAKFVECETPASAEEIAQKYAAMNMDKFLVLTDKDGRFMAAINPRMVESIEVI